jgi:hypothetical protein
VRAVNADSSYGTWRYVVITDPAALAKTLDELCGAKMMDDGIMTVSKGINEGSSASLM